MRSSITWTVPFGLCVITVIYGGSVRDRVCDRRLPNNRVTREDYVNSIATGESFLVIYSVIVNPIPEFLYEYTKARRSFNESGANIAITYFAADDKCFRIEASGFAVTDIKEVRKAGKCLREDTYFRVGAGRLLAVDPYFPAADDQRIKTRFFSQDLSKYFWMFECTNGGGVSSYETCTGTSVFELHIKDIRDPPTVGTELNLNVFPWGFALQDLKDFTGLTISELTYTWLGIECEDFGDGIIQDPTGTTNSSLALEDSQSKVPLTQQTAP